MATGRRTGTALRGPAAASSLLVGALLLLARPASAILLTALLPEQGSVSISAPVRGFQESVQGRDVRGVAAGVRGTMVPAAGVELFAGLAHLRVEVPSQNRRATGYSLEGGARFRLPLPLDLDGSAGICLSQGRANGVDDYALDFFLLMGRDRPTGISPYAGAAGGFHHLSLDGPGGGRREGAELRGIAGVRHRFPGGLFLGAGIEVGRSTVLGLEAGFRR